MMIGAARTAVAATAAAEKLQIISSAEKFPRLIFSNSDRTKSILGNTLGTQMAITRSQTENKTKHEVNEKKGKKTTHSELK